MADITLNYLDDQTVIAASALARGARVAGTIDLTAKFGAWIFPQVGRAAAVALTNGVNLLVFRQVESSGVLVPHAGAYFEQVGLAESSGLLAQTIAADAAAEATAITVNAGTFTVGDLIMISDTSRERLEFNRVLKVAGQVLSLALPLQYAHTAVQADVVSNKAFSPPPIPLEGGSKYTVVFDYMDDTAGSDAHCICRAQVYVKDVSA